MCVHRISTNSHYIIGGLHELKKCFTIICLDLVSKEKNGIIDTIEQFKWVLIQSIKHITMLNAILICLYGVFWIDAMIWYSGKKPLSKNKSIYTSIKLFLPIFVAFPSNNLFIEKQFIL